MSMPANHKVSVGWQIVFTFVPILNLWAFYRIRRLQKYLLYVIAPSIVSSTIIAIYTQIETKRYSRIGDMGLAFGNPESTLGVTILSYVISFGLFALSIYLIVKWSREHNKQFDQPQTRAEPPV